jgi:hypothetical protein
MLALLDVTRVHKAKSGVLNAEYGHTATVDKYELLAGAGDQGSKMRAEVEKHVGAIAGKDYEYKGAG